MSKKSTASKPVTKTATYSFKHSCISQNFALVWLDESIDESNDACLDLIDQLKSVVNSIDVFNHADQCVQFLKSIKKQNIFLILSARLVPTTMPLINDLPALTAVFVLCNGSAGSMSWPKNWWRIRGAFNSIGELCQSLKEKAREVDESSIAMSFVPSSDINSQNLDELDSSFMYTQLMRDILLDLKHDKKSVQELVTYRREKIQGKEKPCQYLQKLETGYDTKSPIWWYSCESFIYSMLNWALREQEFDSIIRMGFFIYDLHQSIAKLHKEQAPAKSKVFKVYRGQGLSPADFEKLKKTKDGLLVFNNFLSTSESKAVAEGFLERTLGDHQLIGIFFTMTVDPSVASVPFASIEHLSDIAKEKEILFSMPTVFRVEGIKPRAGNSRVWEVDLTLTSNTDQQLNRLLERIREEIEGSTPLYRLGALLIRLGQFDKADEVFRKLSDDTPDPLEKAHLNYQRGQIAYNQGKNDQANAFYQRTLEVYQQKLGANHQNVATIYNNMGLVCDSMEDYPQARSHYEKALQIYQKVLPADHPIIATCLSNIASAYDNMKEYQQALAFYERAYQIYKEKLPETHPHFATYYSNIGLVYSNLRQYGKALTCFESASRIGTKALPVGHPDLKVYQQHLETAKKRAASDRK